MTEGNVLSFVPGGAVPSPVNYQPQCPTANMLSFGAIEDTIIRLVEQLHFSNSTVSNLMHELSELRYEMSSMKAETCRLNSIVEKIQSNSIVYQPDSAPNGVSSVCSTGRDVDSNSCGMHCDSRSENVNLNSRRIEKEIKIDDNGRGGQTGLRKRNNELHKVYTENNHDSLGNGPRQGFVSGENVLNRLAVNECANANFGTNGAQNLSTDFNKRNAAHGVLRDDYYMENHAHGHREVEPRLSVSEAEAVFPEFSGMEQYSVRKWVADFEELCDALGVIGLRKFVIAKRKLTGMAKIALNTTEHVSNWISLKNFLMKEFDFSESSAVVHERLRNCKRKVGQNVFEYFLQMREIGAKADVDIMSIITYTINGISDTGHSKAVLYGAKSFDEFKGKLRVYQEIEFYKYGHGNNTYNSYSMRCVRDRRSNDLNRNPVNRFYSKRRWVNCYICGSGDHISKGCPKKFGKYRENGEKFLNSGFKNKKRINDEFFIANVRKEAKFERISANGIRKRIEVGNNEDIFNNMRKRNGKSRYSGRVNETITPSGPDGGQDGRFVGITSCAPLSKAYVLPFRYTSTRSFGFQNRRAAYKDSV